ncbi:MAG: phosphotransferase [Gemmatimonadales bacterium]
MALTQGKAPQFTHEQAVAIAYNLYEISTMARELPSDRDQNFLLRDTSGGSLILKIANADEPIETVDSQTKAMEHIALRDPSLGCPRVRAAISGDMINEVEDESGVSHFVRLLTFVPGVPLALIDSHSPALLWDIGRFFGKLDIALDDFSHPGTERHLAWDLANASDTVRDHIDCVADPKRRALIRNFLARFEAETAPRLAELPIGVIHNDGNDYNVLVDSTDPDSKQVAGIIDFGDMVRTRTVFEPCVAGAYALLDESDPIAAAAQVAAGYNSVCPLTDLELELLFNLICMRLCISVVIAAYRADRVAHNPYLAISERPAWNALQLLATVKADDALLTFRRQLGGGGGTA